jgi:hypothetical protein
MVWNRLQASVMQFIDGAPQDSQPSRRDFLAGMCACGAIGVVGSTILLPAAAEAATVELESTEAQTDIIEVRSHDRGRSRGRPRSRRMSAREVRRRCERDRRFRRRNPNLCRRVRGWRARRGACIQFGPLQICEV